MSKIAPRLAEGNISDRELRFDRGDEFRVLRLDLRAEPTDDLARRGDEELFEVPRNVACLTGRVSHFGELGVDRVTILSVDIDLLREREGHAVCRRAEALDLFSRTWLLTEKLVAGKADDAEPAVLVTLLESLKSGVLRRQSALRSDIDEQKGLALVFLER